MKQYDFLIVGSGLFGAVFAFEAKKHGKKCLVIEKRSHTGGNVRCESIEGITVHKYGAHIFHTSSSRVWSYVNELCEFNNFINSPLANYKGEIYNLPYNMYTFSKLWGISTPDEARAIISEQSAKIKGEPKNLEEQAIKLVGEDVYRKLVKGYTEKQWGRSCSELPAFIFRRLPVRYTYDNNYFNDCYQGIPVGGYNVLIDRLLEGTDVILGTDYNSDRESFNSLADTVLYTGRLDSFYDYRFGRLEYRGLRFETEILDTEDFQGVAVMNYTDRETPFTRIIEHKHFESGNQKKTVITKEFSVECKEDAEGYYPVNDEKNQELFEKYKELAKKEENVIFGGRLAEYKYYDMDKVIESALKTADEVFG